MTQYNLDEAASLIERMTTTVLLYSGDWNSKVKVSRPLNEAWFKLCVSPMAVREPRSCAIFLYRHFYGLTQKAIANLVYNARKNESDKLISPNRVSQLLWRIERIITAL